MKQNFKPLTCSKKIVENLVEVLFRWNSIFLMDQMLIKTANSSSAKALAILFLKRHFSI